MKLLKSLFFIILLIGNADIALSADLTGKSINCPIYKAEYISQSNFHNNDFYYILTSEQKLDRKVGGKPDLYFVISIKDKKTNNTLSDFRSKFIASGGSWTSTFLYLSENKNDKVEVTFLDKDFSLSTRYSTKAPYSIVLANASSRFEHINWKEVSPENIKYHTEKKLKPDFRTPTSWTFYRCNN